LKLSSLSTKRACTYVFLAGRHMSCLTILCDWP